MCEELPGLGKGFPAMSTDQANKQNTVLIVDDEKELAEAYATWIANDYETRVAYNGREALEMVDETVDIVLLDRRMAGLSGDEMLERLIERGIDCRTIMVTAVDPDFEILDMQCDAYLHKPVNGEGLKAAIERQLTAMERGDSATEFVELTSKLDALESTRTVRRQEDRQQIRDLREAADELETDIEAASRLKPR